MRGIIIILCVLSTGVSFADDLFFNYVSNVREPYSEVRYTEYVPQYVASFATLEREIKSGATKHDAVCKTLDRLTFDGAPNSCYISEKVKHEH